MSDAAKLHDEMSSRFVREILGPAIRNEASDSDLMVLFESCQLVLMLLLRDHYGVKAATAAALVEAAHHRATERFAASGVQR